MAALSLSASGVSTSRYFARTQATATGDDDLGGGQSVPGVRSGDFSRHEACDAAISNRSDAFDGTTTASRSCCQRTRYHAR